MKDRRTCDTRANLCRRLWLLAKRVAVVMLCLVLMFYDSAAVLASYNEKPQAKTLTVENSIVKFDIGRKDGRFTISTEDGLPEKKTDNFQFLTFFDDIPETSFTTIRIDGKDYIFGNNYGTRGGVTQETIVIGKIATTVWCLDDVEVIQKVQLVTDMANANVGNVKIRYEIANGSKADVEIGSRILLDTQLGHNDASAMLANSEYITNETVLTGDKLPQVWQSSDRKFASNVVAYGYLFGWDNVSPDKMIAAHWNTLSDTKWDCEVNELLNFTTDKNRYGSADSAVALYYEPTLLKVGETKVIETYYGIGSLSDAVYTGGDFSVQIQAPQKINAGDTFEVAVDITNNTEEILHDLVVEIGFSGELSMSENKSTIEYIGAIDAKDLYRLTFELDSTALSETVVAEMGITVSQGENSSQSMKYVILTGQKGEVPKMQFTEVTPGILYTLDTTKKVTIKGSGFEVLKADQQWTMVCRNERTGEEAEISRADIAISDDSTMMVKLPSDEVLPYKADIYKIRLQTQNYGNMSVDIEFTNDKSYIRKEYGVMLIGGFEKNSDDEPVYGVKLLESEEEVANMSGEERDNILLTIRGEVDTYEVDGKQYYTIESGALINNAIKYSNALNNEAVIMITRYEEQASDSVNESLKNQFSGWEWWGHVSDSLVMTGKGTLSVGDYSFHTGDFYICLEDGNEYELRGAESDESSDIEQEDDTEEVVIKTPIGVVGNNLASLIGVLTGFRIEVSDAVIGVETVSLGGSFSVELPWWSGVEGDDEEDDKNLTAEQKKLKEKFDKNDEVSGAIEGGVNEDSFVELNMEEMRYGLDAEDNSVELVGVAASGGINLTDDSIPKFTKGGAGANFEIDSIEYPGWFIGIDANLKVGDAFECEFGFSLVRENTGKCYPDTISFLVGGKVVKIPLGTLGFLTKMGGGITGLYNTLKQNFNHFPPVTIKFVTGYADPTMYSFKLDTISLSVGGTGIKISGEEGKVFGLKILEEIEAHLLLYGKKDENGVITDCFDMGISSKINIVGIVRGESSIWLMYDPDVEGIFGYLSLGGKAYCGIFIPDWIPVLGGIELLAAMAELSTYRVFAGIRVIGIPISVSYYWADGEVKFFDDWESTAQSLDIPEEDMKNALAVVYDYNADNADGVMLFGDNLTRLESIKAAKGFEYTIDVWNNDYTLIQAGYAKEDLAEGESILDKVKVYNPSGKEIELKENENCLLQHIGADVSESGVDEYNLGIGLVAPENGIWKIVSETELLLTPYKVDEISGVEAKEAVLNENELSIDYEVKEAKQGQMLDVYLAEKEGAVEVAELSQTELQAMSEEELSAYYKQLAAANQPGMKITESPVKLENIQNNAAGGTITIEVPETMQNGTYEVRLVLSEENGAICSDASDNTIVYRNPNTPKDVQNVTLAPGGDGQFLISWGEVSDADGYYVQLLDENGQGLEGFEGITTQDTKLYMGGVYTMPVYAEDEAGNIVFVENKEVGTPSNNHYRALVYAYREVSNTIYPSTAIMTESVYLPEPNPAEITFNVDNTPALAGMMSTAEGLYMQEDSFNSKTNKKNVTMGLTSNQKVELAFSLNEDFGDYAIYTIEAGETLVVPLELNEGSNVVEIFAKNEQGDYTQRSLCIETDTIAPSMMLDNTVVCSEKGNYCITGTVEPNAKVYIGEEEVLCSNGKFAYEGSGNLTLETVEVIAVDTAGNENRMKCELIPKEFSRIVDLYIVADGKKLDSEKDILEMFAGNQNQIEVYGVMENGTDICLQKEKLNYSVLYNHSVVNVSEDGVVSAVYEGDSVITVEYPVTDNYTLEETLSVKVDKYVIEPMEMKVSAQEIILSAQTGEVAAHIIIPNAPASMEVTYTISDNEYLEVSGSDLIYKNAVGQTRNLSNIIITAAGSFLDNENQKQTFAFSQEFAFSLINQIKEVEACVGMYAKVGTPFEELDLPDTVQLLLENNDSIEAKVSWSKGAYSPSVSRQYLLKGTVELPEGITNPNDCRALILVDVEKYMVNNTAEKKQVVYEGQDIDVSGMFTTDANAGEVSYQIIGGTGEATLNGSMLQPVKAGTFLIQMTTAETDMYYEQKIEAVLTVEKGQKDAPEGIIVIHAGTTMSSDGALYGVSPEMEYSSDGGKNYKAIKGNVVKGLGIGTYLVRYKENDLYVAGKTGKYKITNTGKGTQNTLAVTLPSTVTYGCQPLEGKVSGGSGTGETTWTSSNSNVICINGDKLEVVGAGTAVITVTKQEDVNYNSAAVSHSITVKPRIAELKWIGTEDREFDGTASIVEASVQNPVGKDSCKVVVEGGKEIHAGTYQAKAVRLSNANYKLPEDAEVSYTIMPKAVVLEWSDTLLVYNGTDRTSEIYADYTDINGEKVSAVLKVAGKAFTKPGEYPVKAEIEDTDYRIAESDEKMYYIDKAELTVVLAAEGKIHSLDDYSQKSKSSFGSRVTLNAAATGINGENVDGTVAFFRNGERIEEVKAKQNKASISLEKLEPGSYEFTALFTPEDDSCYYAGSSQVLLMKVNQNGEIFVENNQMLPEDGVSDVGIQLWTNAALLLAAVALFGSWLIRKRRIKH